MVEKKCSKCDTIKPLDNFHNQKGTRTGKAHWCKLCANANTRSHHHRNKSNPEYLRKKRDRYFKSNYSISLKEYEAMLESQDFKCAICEVELLPSGNGTHLDHSHKDGNIRAMLCTNCNRGLGHFQDDISILEKAKEYLVKHNSSCEGGER